MYKSKKRSAVKQVPIYFERLGENIEIPLSGDIYGEQAIWLCENRRTGFRTRIQGVLAQILKQYPADYHLQLLKIKEKNDEHSTRTDQ